VSVNSFSQTLPSEYSYADINQPSTRFVGNTDKTKDKPKKDLYEIKRIVRRERIVGSAIFTTALTFFVKGLISTYRINK
jgi:hypothetical protein